jgi:regulatory protein
MAGEITALRYQKRNKNRVNVYVDHRYAFGLAAIVAASLKVGQTLSDADIARLKSRDEAEYAYDRALNFLSYRPRSEAEVRRNLRRKEVPQDTVEAVIARLERAGLLDDIGFANYWVENRIQFNPRGPHALRHELRQKGVADVVIREVLAEIDEESMARTAAATGFQRFAHLEESDIRRKLVAYLARRGFSYAIITPLVEEILTSRTSNATEDEETDYGMGSSN